MQLIIKDLNGKTQVVNVLPSTTNVELKQQLATLFGATGSHLRLSDSSGQILDEVQKTVSDYGLSLGSTLILLITMSPVPFQVSVKNEMEQTKVYNIMDDETVDQLMEKICQIEGVPVDQQRLIYDGQQLTSGKKLQDYNIVSGSTIYMTLPLRGG